jgi:sterol desaturase/sphingolipid hydroxylase (fatty acid hydroxylase superfamily)
LNSSRTEKALYLVKAFSLKTLQVLILGFGVWVILNLCVLAGSTCMLYPKSEVIVKAGEQPFITSMCAIGVVVQLWFYIVHAYPENDPRYDEPPEFMWWY